MRRKSTKIIRWLAVLYAVVVAMVSSWPRLRLPNIDMAGLDKLAHFGQYLILAFLVSRGWMDDAKSSRRFTPLALVAVVIAFAALDEYHQGWIPGRDADVLDWLADLCGIAVGFWIGSGWLRRRGLKMSPRETE